jgi:threonine dehydratase
MSFEEIRESQSRIRDYILENTPLIGLEGLGNDSIYLKLENLQVTGSFKIRGAANKLVKLASSRNPRGIITASAGNHGQAIAMCALKLGMKATIVCPETTPRVKINKIRQFHPELVLHGAIYDEAEEYAQRLAKEKAMEYVSPYNDPDVIAGQGTIGLEIANRLKDLGAVIVPVGGGGLISGIAVAIKTLSPRTEVIGVQSEASPSMYESFLAGRQIDTTVEDSIADGLSGNFEQGSITLELIRKFVDRMVLVKEASLHKAIRLLWERGQIVEGSGGAPVAALLENPTLIPAGRKGVLVLSGANIDFEKLREIITAEP